MDRDNKLIKLTVFDWWKTAAPFSRDKVIDSKMIFKNLPSLLFAVIYLISNSASSQKGKRIELTPWDRQVIKSCERRDITLLRNNLQDPKMKPAVIGHCVYLLAGMEWDKATRILKESENIKFHPKYLEKALLKACSGMCPPLVAALLAAGADPSAQNSLPLVTAVKGGVRTIIHHMLSDPRVDLSADDNLLFKSLPLMSIFRELWDHPSAPLNKLGAELLLKSLVERRRTCLVDLISHPNVDKTGIEEIAESILLHGPQKEAELVFKALPLITIIFNSEPDLTPEQYIKLSEATNLKGFENPISMIDLWERTDALIALLKASLASRKYNLLQLLLNKLPPAYLIKNEEQAVLSILTRAISLDNVKALDILLGNAKFSGYKSSPNGLEKLARIIILHDALGCFDYFVREVIKMSKKASFWMSRLDSARPKLSEFGDQGDYNGCAYNYIIDQLFSVANNELRKYPFTSKLFKNMISKIAADDALVIASPLPEDCRRHILNFIK